MRQDYNSEGVKQERTGWRDADLSARHREWGFDCPFGDIDFLAFEYNTGRPVAFVEYKRYTAQLPDFEHPFIKAVTTCANNSEIPFIVAVYWPETWSFRVYPVNIYAQEEFDYAQSFDEKGFVTKLYKLRNKVIREVVLNNLRTTPPPSLELRAA